MPRTLRIARAVVLRAQVALSPLLSAGPLQAATQDRDTTQTGSAWWKPVTWSIGGSILWRDKDGKTEVNFDIDLRSEWAGPNDQFDVTIRSAYELDDGAVDRNEQYGTATWFHDFTGTLFTLVEGGLERNMVELQVPSGDTEDFDYVVLRATGGAGVRRQWSARALTRMAVLWSQVHLRLLEPGAGAWTHAVVVHLDGDFRPADRTRLTNWSRIYFWKEGDRGFESQSELAFDIFGNLALGFRHRFRKNAATLEAQHENELRVFTRVRF